MVRELKRAYQEWQTGLFREGWFAHTFVRVMGRLATPIYDWAFSLMREDLAAARAIADIGCGNGLMSRRIARSLAGKSFALLDQSAAQLAAGAGVQASMRAQGHEVSVHVAPAERMPFEDARFDLVLSTGSINLWSDPAQGLRECARVARPGAVLWVFDQRPVDSLRLAADALVRHRVFGLGIPGYTAERVVAFAGAAGLGTPRVYPDGSLYGLRWQL